MNRKENLIQAFAAMPRTTWPWFVLAAAILVADQGSKAWVSSGLLLGDRIALTEFFNLVHVLNTGAAFSFLADAGGWQRYAFSVLGIAVSVWMAREIRQGQTSRMECFAYAMIIGGALGNVVDRVFRGAVTDFLDFHWQGMHWPAFNFADIAINIGVLAMLLGIWRQSRFGQDRGGEAA
ncbi:signal peptidase II [Uliginosibacterium sp. 31-16]|uniref:signal peptidase II n=1 Tax=Uliginosibacterium sp. 31-16 TaxID=3068315 RepID=UPI00273E80C6|nr:signal peptidase II [Uliginosibacterium sp. 31-16]MDP5239470.1 signal peptidase II [Uliginosibacterium sp. 31-16]